jgi:gliding motility-associated-like protein
MYTGQDASSIFWDFGNGDTSTAFNPIYTFTEPGTFIITQIVDGENTCNMADTFYLEIDVFGGTSTSQNISFCPGQDDQIIDAFTNNATYIWSDGTSASSISVNSPGIYWVDISIDGCMRRDTFLVGATTLIDFGDDLNLCENTPVLLEPNFANAASYTWQDGSNSPTYNVTVSGEYWVSVIDDGGCEYSDTINIEFLVSPIIDIGPDTSLCQIDSFSIDATSDFGNTYIWDDGSDGPILSVMESGQYFVTVSNGSCETIDSIQIEFTDLPNVSFLTTDIDCGGANNGSINTIIEGGANLDFLWSNNAITPSIENLDAGDYGVTISQGVNCSFDTIISITEPAVLDFNLTSLPEECPGFSNGSIALEIISGGTPPFLFGIAGEDLSDEFNIDNLSPGQYSVIVQDSNMCRFTGIIDVGANSINTVDAGPDRNIIFGESVQIDALLSSFENQIISWTPSDSLSCSDCINPIANPIENTTYTITVTDTIFGCIVSDQMLIIVERPINVFIPNVFSPNNDGINDSFFIQGDQTVSNILYLRIYNRWGDQVFAAENMPPNDSSLGWDGRFLEKEMNSQVFVYAAEVEFIDGTKLLFKGDVTLIK